MRFDIVTLFPPMFIGPLDHSIVGRARARGQLDVRVHDLRAWTTDRHRTADDAPFGGGIGMVLKPEPFFRAVEALRDHALARERTRVVLLSAQGRLFDDAAARELAGLDQLILLCGHYEGVDERVAAHLADEELSIGDYVLTGGELAAMVVVDAVARYVPGVLEAEATAAESHAAGLLEHPQYTRPAEFRGWRVPGILLSGDHAAIARWRRQQALLRTWQRRPDLLQRAALTPDDRALLAEALATARERGLGRPEEPGPSVSQIEWPRTKGIAVATVAAWRQRHADEWLLVGVTREAAGRPAAGVLVAHGTEKATVIAAALRLRALEPAAPLYLLRAGPAVDALVVPVWLGTLAVDVLPDLGSAETRLSPDALWLAGVGDRRALRRTGRQLRLPLLRVGRAELRDAEVIVEPPLREGLEGALGTAALAAVGARIDVAARRLLTRRRPSATSLR